MQLSFSPDSTLFGCMGADKSLELFRVHSPEEVRRRQKKRIKRTLAKKKDSADGMISSLLFQLDGSQLARNQYQQLFPLTSFRLYPFYALHIKYDLFTSVKLQDTRYLFGREAVSSI